MRRAFVCTGLAIALSLAMPGRALAYNWYYDLAKAHYTLTGRTQSCVVCHARSASERLNPYGAAFLAAGAGARSIAAIAGVDSDGDGFTNDVELRTGHFPGEAADFPDPAQVRALKARKPVLRDPYLEIYETLQCPCCDKLVMNCKCDMVPEIQRIVRHGLEAGESAKTIKERLVAKYGREVLPLGERSETLPPERFTEPRIASAYRIAAAIPAALDRYPCFCACYQTSGHVSLLDCYKNAHGARCTVCLDEAEVIRQMTEAKKPEKEIRAALLSRFGARH
ncbi:MAG: cytochrome c-type biogenesis protein CcmH [Candidatus Eisenbacteria bacterium]|nr:cytochrome c-type biogenesis protein CcmH [Candidatus Eisenbacteria bacterium]